MNQSLLKSFAPQARNRFRAAMEQRAALLGLCADKEPVPAQKSGAKIYIGAMAFPVQWEEQRKKLAGRIARHGWNAVMEEAAYTWFNRFAALRYMEVHCYMPQGMRVLTPTPQGSQPEILERAASINLPGLKKQDILELRLDGQRDEELYRLLVLALCESFHSQLPLLFPAVQEDLELLLPDMQLRSDSLLSWFVQGLPDEEWQEIEVLGWLYQYYISELKSEYMARKTAYKKEEIPAVTQLFTPKWIVQYLVHNSLGCSWLLHHPESGLKAKMPYYIEPAPQEPEVDAELKRLFSGDLNPEDIKLLDPAMGSGHILVTAYEVLREIYLERGYQRQQCARLILEKNLYGLDIDLRATEIACFALIMKAREDDPTILTSGSGLRLNLLSFRDCTVDERTDIIQNLPTTPDQKADLTELLTLFEQGTLFGSLIQIPEELTKKLRALTLWLEQLAISSELLASKAAESALVFVQLAQVLGQKYDQVVSNPPYLGTKGMSPSLKSFVEQEYKNGKSDLFACFMLRGFDWLDATGFNAMVTMQSWMFLSSYEDLRVDLLDNRTIVNMAHLGARAFSQINGEIVQTTAFSFMHHKLLNYKATYFRLINGSEEVKQKALDQKQFAFCNTKQIEFNQIPGRPVAYWCSDHIRKLFIHHTSEIAKFVCGMTTGDNNKFIRYWCELKKSNTGFGLASEKEALESDKKWFPYNKGGDYRKWYGNNEYVINWKNNGQDVINNGRAFPRARNFYFHEGITWTFISSSRFGVRYSNFGSIFDMSGCSAFPERKQDIFLLTAYLCTPIASELLEMMNPTLNFQVGNVASLPWINELPIDTVNSAKKHSGKMIATSKSDWDAFETSWDFQALPWLPSVLPDYLNGTGIASPDQHSLASCWDTWRFVGQHWTAEMLRLEEENNRLFIDAYGLQDELTPDVPIEQITLTVNPWYRYKPRKKAAEDDSSGPGIEMEILDEGGSPNQDCNEEPGAERTRSAGPQIFPEGEERMKEDGARELVSYAIGCAMGRYSLDARGLIYAEAGGQRFDSAQYPTFPADDDGILPITDMRWFDEDGADRVETFVRTVWGEERHDENMTWLANGLGVKGNESPDETLRRYLAGDFYKDHLQTYKKRPIYWKFSSGKEKAFEALVYLHRYNKGTLSRMRMQFVVPLTGQIRKKMDSLEIQIRDAASTAERKRLEKEQATLQKKLVELAKFDEELNHYAQLQIALDLDDGVRVNYGKFGGLLANVKDVIGKVDD